MIENIFYTEKTKQKTRCFYWARCDVYDSLTGIGNLERINVYACE